MLSKEFESLVNQFGVHVTVNDETKKHKAIITNRRQTPTMPDFDDKNIHTTWKLERGMVIHYEDVQYLIISDVQSKRSHEYKAIIRPMTNTFRFTYWTEGYFEERDRLGNPIWIIEPEEVTENYPCIAQQKGSPTIVGTQIRQAEERVKVIMPDNYITQQIEINTNHQLYNRYYKIVDINLLQSGLRILTMEWTSSPPSS